MSKKALWTAILLTAIAPMLWGSTYLVTTEFLPEGRPFIAAFLRVFPAGLLLLLYTREWPNSTIWKQLIVLSILNIGAFQALLFIAAYRLPGGIAAILGALQPLIIMLIAWLLDKKTPAFITLIACIASVVGITLLLITPQATWDTIGIIAALMGAIFMASGTYLTHRWQTGLSLLGLTGWQLFIGAVFLAPFAYSIDPPLTQISLAEGLAYSYLSLAGALLAYFLWFKGIKMLPPVAVASLGLLSPITAVFLGWALLGQNINGVALAGLLIVLISVLIVQWKTSQLT